MLRLVAWCLRGARYFLDLQVASVIYLYAVSTFVLETTTMDAWINQIDGWEVALTLAVAMLAGWGIAWWSGSRAPSDPDERSTGRFVDGSLAMLALLLGFTFAMALDKHEQRRLAVISDSNSIGDFYTCASLLREPTRSQLQNVIREYVDHRVQAVRKAPSGAEYEETIGQVRQMHNRMVQLVDDAVNAGTPVTVPLVNTCNALTSNNASRLAAARDRLPWEVVVLLLMSAVIVSVLVGRYHGLRHKPNILSTISYMLIVVSAVYVIIDLNQPASGLIRVNQESMERLAASIAAQ